MVIYQIWNETDVGPCFATEDEALHYLGCGTREHLKAKTEGYGYPSIQPITVGDKKFYRDR